MKELITKLNFNQVAQKVANGSNIFYCGPGITTEISSVLLQLVAQNHQLFIVCDMDTQNDYRGMNEIEEMKKLFDLPKVQMKNSKGINVSLFSDLQDFNYFFFPVSKIFKSEPEGYNAVAFDGFLALSLFTQFFPELSNKSPDEFTALLNKQKEIGIEKLIRIENPLEKLNEISLNAEPISIKQINLIQKTVKEFPPEKPNLQRMINFVNNHIQVVDLKFEGANWQTKRVTIPQNLIPYKSEELKRNLDSKLRIFSEIDQHESLNEFNKLKKKIDDLRKDFLFRSKLHNKNIIKLNEKELFKKQIQEFDKEVVKFRDSLFKLIREKISNSKAHISKELIEYYKKNPDNRMKQYKTNFDDAVEDEVESMMRNIRFPTVDEIIGEFKLTLSFFNFTYEDLTDDEFLIELADWDKLTAEEYFELFEKQKGFETQAKKKITHE